MDRGMAVCEAGRVTETLNWKSELGFDDQVLCYLHFCFTFPTFAFTLNK